MNWRNLWAFLGGLGLIMSFAAGQLTGVFGCIAVIVLASMLPKAL